MGCVLGKLLHRQPKSPADPFPPRSSEQPPTTTINNIMKDQLKSDNQYLNGNNHHQSRFLAPEKTIHGWPAWLCSVAGDSINDWTPRRANTFQKIDKGKAHIAMYIKQGIYMITGEIVALQKVRFDNCEPESLKFMAREILVLKKLDHPNVIKLLGLVTSTMSSSLYLVFEYMDHDLSGLAAAQPGKFMEPQVKCFMKQLLSVLDHCHNHGVLHRDIKAQATNDKSCCHPVVPPPELLLGATHYGIGVDLWSAGCNFGGVTCRETNNARTDGVLHSMVGGCTIKELAILLTSSLHDHDRKIEQPEKTKQLRPDKSNNVRVTTE